MTLPLESVMTLPLSSVVGYPSFHNVQSKHTPLPAYKSSFNKSTNFSIIVLSSSIF